ncbi:MAG: HAD-IB family hydrolase [Robiginitomaculum sp.]
MDKQRIAIFDLDQTLTVKGTWGRFVSTSIHDRPFKWLAFVMASVFSQIKYMIGFGPRERVKETMMRWTLSGRSRRELELRAQNFAQNEVDNGLRARSLQMLKFHKEQGDRIVIASAAVDLVVAPIADRLGITEIVCTKVTYDENEKLKPKLGSQNCYGRGKLEMVKAYLEKDIGYSRDQAHITMYSDSSSDLDILRWADVGIGVNPSPKLANLATKYGFKIQDWDKG